MPQTTRKGYEIQTTGSNAGTWGTVLNDNMIQYVDDNFSGLTTLSLASTTPQLLTAAQARNAMLRLTGTLTANIVISPDTGVLMNGIYCWENITSGAFTCTLTTSTGSVVLPQTSRGLVFLDSTNAPRIIGICGSSNADPVPLGTIGIWYQAAAPSGWSAVAINDYAIKIVTNGSGGVTSGSVAYSTLFGRTATDAHTLTTSEIPSHQHGVAEVVNVSPVQGGGGTTYAVVVGSTSTGATGGGASHTHGLDMRVQTAAFSMYQRTG